MNERPRDSVRGAPALLFLSAGLVALALWSGRLGTRQWSVALLIFVALATGVAGGILFAGLWRAEARSEAEGESDLALLRRLSGPAGALLVFLGCVVFAAVEAHAIGSGVGAGAPGATVALLGPPLVIGAVALRRALRHGVATGGTGGGEGKEGAAGKDGGASSGGMTGGDDRRREA